MAIAFYGLALFLLCLAQVGSNRIGEHWRMMLPPGPLHGAYAVLSLVSIVGFWGWLVAGPILFGVFPMLGCLVVAAGAAYVMSMAVHPGYGAMFVVFGTPLAGVFTVLACGVR